MNEKITLCNVNAGVAWKAGLLTNRQVRHTWVEPMGSRKRRSRRNKLDWGKTAHVGTSVFKKAYLFNCVVFKKSGFCLYLGPTVVLFHRALFNGCWLSRKYGAQVGKWFVFFLSLIFVWCHIMPASERLMPFHSLNLDELPYNGNFKWE